MKHLKKFNEDNNVREFDEYSDEDIKMLFTDYTDEDPDSLKIENVLIYDGRVIKETPYMKDVSKYRKAKVVTLDLGDLDGISLPGMSGKCSTSFDKIQKVIKEIDRFYDLSEEKEVNFNIGMDWSGLKITFVLMGGYAKQEETMSDKIDGYLIRAKEWLNSMGHKRVTIKGNWLDARFAKKNDYSFGISDTFYKVGNGTMNLDNPRSDRYIPLIELRNEAWEDGLKFDISGGDQQVVLKLVRR
jgi:hypothetical protein